MLLAGRARVKRPCRAQPVRLDSGGPFSYCLLGMAFLLSLLAAKGLGALLGGIILLTRSVPGFADPTLVAAGDSIRIQTTLRHAFNKDLSGLLESGTTVAIGFTVTLQSREPDGTVLVSEPLVFYHSAAFDPFGSCYAVHRTELIGTPDSLALVDTRREAIELMGRLDAALVARSDLPSAAELSCQLLAALNTITIEAMEGRELDLNVFWNYRYPRATTRWLKLDRQ